MTASEKLTIETPEQIALEFPLAGVGSRFLALAFDTLIQAAIGLAIMTAWAGVAAVSGPVFGGAAAIWTLAIVVLLGFLVMYGYFAAFEIWWQGQTPGKRLLKLRVISASGRPITAYQALLRNLLRLADQLPGLYAVGIASVLLTARSQRLGDLAASTVVVHERPTTREYVAPAAPRIFGTPVEAGAIDRRWQPADVMTGVADSPRGRLNARRLNPDEITLIDRFLQRRTELEPDVRERAAFDIATRIRQRLDLPPDANHEDLLERVTAEYRTLGAYR